MVVVDVVDKGVRYEVPKMHLGAPVAFLTPAHIGEPALAYLDAMIKEAEALT